MKAYHIGLCQEMQDMSRLESYHGLKENFELEKYVTIIRDHTQCNILTKSRMGTLPVRVATGRYRGTFGHKEYVYFVISR